MLVEPPLADVKAMTFRLPNRSPGAIGREQSILILSFSVPPAPVMVMLRSAPPTVKVALPPSATLGIVWPLSDLRVAGLEPFAFPPQVAWPAWALVLAAQPPPAYWKVIEVIPPEHTAAGAVSATGLAVLVTIIWHGST